MYNKNKKIKKTSSLTSNRQCLFTFFLFFSVRHKVKEIIDFVQDNERLRQERKRAKQNREKYIGLSSDVVSDGFYSTLQSFFLFDNFASEFNVAV